MTLGAMVMEPYICSLRQCAPSPPKFVAQNAGRLKVALEKFHTKGWFHLDVKEDNIFVDVKGCWYLGDYDACVPNGQPIHRTSHWCFTAAELTWNTRDIVPATSVHDTAMLRFVVAQQLHKYLRHVNAHYAAVPTQMWIDRNGTTYVDLTSGVDLRVNPGFLTHVKNECRCSYGEEGCPELLGYF